MKTKTKSPGRLVERRYLVPGYIPQGEIGVVIVAIIQGFYSVCGSGIRLHLTASGDLEARFCSDWQDRTYQDRG